MNKPTDKELIDEIRKSENFFGNDQKLLLATRLELRNQQIENLRAVMKRVCQCKHFKHTVCPLCKALKADDELAK